MKQIRWGLEDNLDVSVYAKSNLTHNQMNEIRYSLSKKLNISKYANLNFNVNQLK